MWISVGCVVVGVVGVGLHFVAERHIPQSRKIRTKYGTVRSYMEKGLGMAQRTRLTYGRCACMLQTNSLPFFLLCGRSGGTENALSAGRLGSGALAETSGRKSGAWASYDGRRRCFTQVPKPLALDPLLPL